MKQYDNMFRFIGFDKTSAILDSIQSKIDKLYKFIVREQPNTKFKKPTTLCYWEKEHNVFEFTNAHFSAQYTIGKNGKVYKRILSLYNHKPSFGRWIETEKTEIDDELKSRCESLYINIRI